MQPDATAHAPVFARIDKIAHVAIPLLQPTSGLPRVSLAAFVTPGKEAPVIAPEPSAAPGILTMNAFVRPPAPGEAIVPTLADFPKLDQPADQPLTLRVKKQRSRKRATAPRGTSVCPLAGSCSRRVGAALANGVRIPVAPAKQKRSSRNSRKKRARDDGRVEVLAPVKEEDDLDVEREPEEVAIPGPNHPPVTEE